MQDMIRMLKEKKHDLLESIMKEQNFKLTNLNARETGKKLKKEEIEQIISRMIDKKFE